MQFKHQIRVEKTILDNPEYLKNVLLKGLYNLVHFMDSKGVEFKQVNKSTPDGSKEYELQLQVFKQDDWQQFKNELRDHLIERDVSSYDMNIIKTLLDRLENKL